MNLSTKLASIVAVALAIGMPANVLAQEDSRNRDRPLQLSISEDGKRLTLADGVGGQMAVVVAGLDSDANQIPEVLAGMGARFIPQVVVWAGLLDQFGTAHIEIDLRSDAAGQRVLFQAFSWVSYERGGLPNLLSDVLVAQLRRRGVGTVGVFEGADSDSRRPDDASKAEHRSNEAQHEYKQKPEVRRLGGVGTRPILEAREPPMSDREDDQIRPIRSDRELR